MFSLPYVRKLCVETTCNRMQVLEQPDVSTSGLTILLSQMWALIWSNMRADWSSNSRAHLILCSQLHYRLAKIQLCVRISHIPRSISLLQIFDFNNIAQKIYQTDIIYRSRSALSIYNHPQTILVLTFYVDTELNLTGKWQQYNLTKTITDSDVSASPK